MNGIQQLRHSMLPLNAMLIDSGVNDSEHTQLNTLSDRTEPAWGQIQVASFRLRVEGCWWHLHCVGPARRMLSFQVQRAE
eukprot:337897-Rhodomonas_salina.2